MGLGRNFLLCTILRKSYRVSHRGNQCQGRILTSNDVDEEAAD